MRVEVKNMSLLNCNCNCSCKCNCTLWAVIASVFVGVIAAFLQITGVINVTPAFLWVLLGIAVVYLAVIVLASALTRGVGGCPCKCGNLSAVLVGILGTVFLSIVLLAVGTAATSVISAILVGLLLLAFSLIVSATACYARCLADCGD